LERLEASKVLEEYCNAQVKLLKSSLSQPSPTQSNFPWEGVFLVLGLVLAVGVYYYLTLEVPRPTELIPVVSPLNGIENLVVAQYAPGQITRVFHHAENLLNLAFHQTGLSPAQIINEAQLIYDQLREEYVIISPLIEFVAAA